MIDKLINIPKSWQTVVGGFLIHLVLGTLYVWANITNAVTSYLRRYDPQLTYNDTIIVYAAALAAQGCTMLLGGLISQRIGPKYCCLIGSAIIITGTFLSSISTSYSEIIFSQGVMLGLGIGICYTAPISASVRWLPHRKGLVTGIIVGGFGCGAFVYGFIATAVVNPDKKNVEISGPDMNYFSKDSEVVARVPEMYFVLAACYAACLFSGCLLLSEPSEEQVLLATQELTPIHTTTTTKKSTRVDNLGLYQSTANSEDLSELEENPKISSLPLPEKVLLEEDEEKKKLTIELGPREILSSPLAWHVASCLITTAVGGMYLAGTFKTYAQQTIHDETFLASVSSTASLFNTFGRFFWGWLGDSIGPMRTLQLMGLLFAVTIFTYANSIALGPPGFAIWTFLIFFFEGANFVLYMPVTVLLFGSKNSAANYGLIFSSYSLFVVLNISVMAGAKVSFENASLRMGLLTGLGFLNLLLLELHIRLTRKNLLDECKFR